MARVETAQRSRAASLEELEARGRLVVSVEGHTICLLVDEGEVYAVDNRCPHMGFPLHRGSVADGTLTCHWHPARFDLCTGGTFDQWADNLRRFPVEVDGDDIYVDVSPRTDARAHQRARLRDGLERDLPLVLAKNAIALADGDPTGVEAFRAGLEFGVARRGGGWFRGLTTLTCLMNLVPRLDPEERPAALYHGLADVASESAGDAPRFPVGPLPGEPREEPGWDGRRELVKTVLNADADVVLDALLAALHEGAGALRVASAVTFAAATRIARFPTSNEFSDWDTALHTFTFANAVEQGLRRSASPELLRAVLDGAMSVYLDRFLNVPAIRLPQPLECAEPSALRAELPKLLVEQQRVDDAGRLVVTYTAADGDPARLVGALGAGLLREDRNFHTIQCVEAAARQHERWRGTGEGTLPLIAAARYLAAHAPTARAQRQTYDIARRLHRGEKLYEDAG